MQVSLFPGAGCAQVEHVAMVVRGTRFACIVRTIYIDVWYSGEVGLYLYMSTVVLVHDVSSSFQGLLDTAVTAPWPSLTAGLTRRKL